MILTRTQKVRTEVAELVTYLRLKNQVTALGKEFYNLRVVDQATRQTIIAEAILYSYIKLRFS